MPVSSLQKTLSRGRFHKARIVIIKRFDETDVKPNVFLSSGESNTIPHQQSVRLIMDVRMAHFAQTVSKMMNAVYVSCSLIQHRNVSHATLTAETHDWLWSVALPY